MKQNKEIKKESVFGKLALVGLMAWSLFVAGGVKAATNEVNRLDPKFVTASILIAEPGEDLCSYLGHTYIRLECPTYKLDYCYSYESEGIIAHPWRFLLGDLKMGMFALPTKDYLEIYRNEQRGVKQYFLDLSPVMKQRLWEVLDRLVERGVDVPYDPLGKSCAVAILQVLGEACRPQKLGFSRWPFDPEATIREIGSAHSENSKWYRFFLSALFGTQVDKAMDPFNKVVFPADLLGVLSGAIVDGKPIIAATPVQLVPEGPKREPMWFTPMMAAVIFALFGVVALVRPFAFINWLYLGFQLVLGLFVSFLLMGSMLPLNPWNWLIVPFNPLVVFGWKWRRYWMLPFVGALLVWEGFMIFGSHRLIDWSYVVIVGGYVAWYIGNFRKFINK